MGLLLNDSRAFQGYTLIAAMFSKTTYLIDMDGKVVRTWVSDYTPGASAYLLDNGHLLRTGALQPQPAGFGPGGGGRLQEFDADGQLVWDFKYAPQRAVYRTTTSPDFPNGNVAEVVVWEQKKREDVIAAGHGQTSLVTRRPAPRLHHRGEADRQDPGEIVWSAPLGPSGPGSRPVEAKLRKRGRASRARRCQLRALARDQ